MMNLPDVTPEEVRERLERGPQPVILDVRTPEEYAAIHIPGAVLIPVDELPARWQELDPDAPTVVVCAHGIRSAAATAYLRDLGFGDCVNMRRGMSAWPGPVERGLPG